MANPKELYEKIANQIIAELEQGTVPWIKPWTSLGISTPMNHISGKPYRGINVLMTWITMMQHEYRSARFLTYKQALEAGGHVKKGEKSTPIYFYKLREGSRENADTGETETFKYPLLRQYFVFNVDQCEGIELPKVPPKKWSDHKVAEQTVRDTGAIVKHGGDRAFYVPSQDFIQMPKKEQFKRRADYYSVLLHELTHWTGHKDRCNRDFNSRFGDEAYAAEELVAEIGSAFICARIGFKLDGLQHPAYIKNWLKVLKDDPAFIMKAANLAQKAADHVFNEVVEYAKAA